MEEILNKAMADGSGIVLDLVLTVLVPYAIILGRAWLKEKTALIKDQRVREGVEFALDRLDKTAQTVTAEIRQRCLVRSPETGKVTNAASIQEKGIKRLHARLDADTRTMLKGLYGDELVKIYRSKIEQHAKG